MTYCAGFAYWAVIHLEEFYHVSDKKIYALFWELYYHHSADYGSNVYATLSHSFPFCCFSVVLFDKDNIMILILIPTIGNKNRRATYIYIYRYPMFSGFMDFKELCPSIPQNLVWDANVPCFLKS
jgi:hypothetical protein